VGVEGGKKPGERFFPRARGTFSGLLERVSGKFGTFSGLLGRVFGKFSTFSGMSEPARDLSVKAPRFPAKFETFLEKFCKFCDRSVKFRAGSGKSGVHRVFAREKNKKTERGGSLSVVGCFTISIRPFSVRSRRRV
jgi:hypothetical protein